MISPIPAAPYIWGGTFAPSTMGSVLAIERFCFSAVARLSLVGVGGLIGCGGGCPSDAWAQSTTRSHWHQWRGPDATGVSPTADPPLRWSETENVRWKIPIDGRGTSTPIIWGDRVFVLTAIDTGIKDAAIADPKDQPKTNYFDIKRPNTAHDFVVLCLDRQTGEEIWRRVAIRKVPHQGAHNDNDFASASPTTDGRYLVCGFGSAGLYCYGLDGELIWKRDLGEVNVGSSLGEGCSPVLHEGKVVVVRDHAGQSSIEVFDVATGKPLWRRDRDEGNAWATPVVVRRGNHTQIITAASKAIRSYDLDTGEVIWRCGGLTGNVTPCPVVDGDRVICMSGYEGYAAVALPLDRTGDLNETDAVIWQRHSGTPYIPSPLLYDGRLFYTQSNQSILTCLDAATGRPVFGPTRIGRVGNLYASPIGAAGRVYMVGRSGTTLVIKRSDSLERLATNTLDDRFDASPATVDDQLFLRGAKNLYCIQEDRD